MEHEGRTLDPTDPEDAKIIAAAGQDEDEGTLFPAGSFEGDRVTAQALVTRGTGTVTTVALSRAEVPSKGGLLNPNKSGRVLVSYAPGKVEYVPQRDEAQRIESWKLRQHLRATFVVDANDEAGLIRSEFANLVRLDVRAAAELLDEMQGVVSEELAKA